MLQNNFELVLHHTGCHLPHCFPSAHPCCRTQFTLLTNIFICQYKQIQYTVDIEQDRKLEAEKKVNNDRECVC